MAKREIIEVDLNDDKTISEKIVNGKVIIVVLDGVHGDVRKFEAVEHGQTVVECVKGKFVKARWREDSLAR